MNQFSKWAAEFLAEENTHLTLPKIVPCKKISLLEIDSEEEFQPFQYPEQPLAAGKVFAATACLDQRISQGHGKEYFSVTLSSQEIQNIDFEPGDTIGILTQNPEDLVHRVLTHIHSVNDKKLYKIINEDTKKSYLPKSATLRELFRNYVELRKIPMKQQLAVLACHTNGETEKRKLEFLASKEGASMYQTLILEGGADFLTVLTSFPTCQPPATVLLEILPRLTPRPYSIASSKLASSSTIRIAFSVRPEPLEGITTGMMRRLLTNKSSEINERIGGISPLGPNKELLIYLRKSHGFRLPGEDSVPLVFVGFGTGVSPFVGFLQHLQLRNVKRTIYLFAGFRNRNKNLFEQELNKYREEGFITKLALVFKEEPQDFQDVQQALKAEWKNLGKAILEDGGLFYECGDVKKRQETVAEAFRVVIEQYLGISKEEAEVKLKELRREKRYLQDTWC